MIVSSSEAMNPSRRNTMEDRHSIHLAGTWHAPDPELSYLGIYDGHGGRDMVDFLEHALPFHVAQELQQQKEQQAEQQQEQQSSRLPQKQQQQQKQNLEDNNNRNKMNGIQEGSEDVECDGCSPPSIETRLERAFLMADLHARQVGIKTSGATVAICLVKPISRDSLSLPQSMKQQQQQQRFVELIVANAGDTRVVLGAVGGQPAERLSVDHRVDDPNEVQRIAQAGGFCYKGRALGVLAVTRSLGDQLFKEFVIAQPAVRTLIVPTNAITTTTTPTPAAPVAPALDSRDPHPSVTNGENGNTTRSNNNDDDARIILPNSNPNYSGTVVDVASVPSFVILACDGLWDVMSDQEAVDLVREFPGNKRDVADQLVQEGLTRGSTDNLTVLVAWL